MIRKLFSLFRKDRGASLSKEPAATPESSPRGPEEACGIDPEQMSPEEIRKRLAELFRRHNAAESSLNPELREEARHMLKAIVICRQKYVDRA